MALPLILTPGQAGQARLALLRVVKNMELRRRGRVTEIIAEHRQPAQEHYPVALDLVEQAHPHKARNLRELAPALGLKAIHEAHPVALKIHDPVLNGRTQRTIDVQRLAPRRLRVPGVRLCVG